MGRVWSCGFTFERMDRVGLKKQIPSLRNDSQKSKGNGDDIPGPNLRYWCPMIVRAQTNLRSKSNGKSGLMGVVVGVGD
jgi:hypothetical protein